MTQSWRRVDYLSSSLYIMASVTFIGSFDWRPGLHKHVNLIILVTTIFVKIGCILVCIQLWEQNKKQVYIKCIMYQDLKVTVNFCASNQPTDIMKKV